VEIDPKSIAYAKANAKLNGVEEKCSFKAGKSEEIFAGVGAFPWEKTAVVIDVSRRPAMNRSEPGREGGKEGIRDEESENQSSWS